MRIENVCLITLSFDGSIFLNQKNILKSRQENKSGNLKALLSNNQTINFIKKSNLLKGESFNFSNSKPNLSKSKKEYQMEL